MDLNKLLESLPWLIAIFLGGYGYFQSKANKRLKGKVLDEMVKRHKETTDPIIEKAKEARTVWGKVKSKYRGRVVRRKK